MVKILIVEDEKPIADLLDMSLTAAGYSCDCLDNGTDAADAVEAKRYDLILLDVMLPGVDGFELILGVRQVTSMRERSSSSFIRSRSARRPSRQFFRKDSIPSASSRTDWRKL